MEQWKVDDAREDGSVLIFRMGQFNNLAMLLK